MTQLELVTRINKAKEAIGQREHKLEDLKLDRDLLPRKQVAVKLKNAIEFETVCIAELNESLVIWQALLILEMSKELDSVKCLLFEVADCAGVEICEEHWCKEPCEEC